MLTAIAPNGYGSTVIFNYREPYGEAGATGDEADRVTKACTFDFARRLSKLLADP